MGQELPHIKDSLGGSTQLIWGEQTIKSKHLSNQETIIWKSC